MRIGEKIKRLRTAKLMTQSELVGSEITRNMLSRIENGTANPSLETILYIAGRLNVSPGFLLAEDEDEKIYFKHNEMVGIKRSFLNEDYRICRDMCLRATASEDDEVQMLLAECNLAIGVEEFCMGRLRSACEYFDEAIESCEKTLYRTDFIVSAVGVYFRYLRRLSATLSSNMIDEEEFNVYPSRTDEFCRYCMALETLDAEGTGEVGYEEIGRSDSPLRIHIEAEVLMKRGAYREAYDKLHGILMGESSIPEPVLYFVFCGLEICCRENGDFKGAYEYSINKMELLQKLLTQA